MDFFFFQLAIIFLPGLIWERIVAKYALARPPTSFETGLRTFTFGLTCYFITFAIFSLLSLDVVIPEVKRDEPFIVDMKYVTEFSSAISVSFVGSVLWFYAINFRWMSRI